MKYIINKLEIAKVNILSLSKLIISAYKYFILFFLMTTVFLCIINNFKDITGNLMFLVVFVLGFLGSFIIHEYMHIICMKRFGIKKVVISNNMYKFSLKTEENLRGIKLIITSVSGPLICGIIGFALYVFFHNNASICLDFIIYLYCFHLINIIPIFGDGKMIIKGILTLHK